MAGILLQYGALYIYIYIYIGFLKEGPYTTVILRDAPHIQALGKPQPNPQASNTNPQNDEPPTPNPPNPQSLIPSSPAAPNSEWICGQLATMWCPTHARTRTRARAHAHAHAHTRACTHARACTHTHTQSEHKHPKPISPAPPTHYRLESAKASDHKPTNPRQHSQPRCNQKQPINPTIRPRWNNDVTSHAQSLNTNTPQSRQAQKKDLVKTYSIPKP